MELNLLASDSTFQVLQALQRQELIVKQIKRSCLILDEEGAQATPPLGEELFRVDGCKGGRVRFL